MEGCVAVSCLPAALSLLTSEDPFDCHVQCDTPFVALSSPGSDQCHVTRHRAYVTWLEASASCGKERAD
ncbi:hypothetical protein ACOMHN_030247 [Nucella lapillus]